MNILTGSHPALSSRCPGFDFAAPVVDPASLAKLLAETMIMAKGIGLAAPQIGVMTRAFVMKVGAGWMGCFNPIVLSDNGGSDVGIEGCLSYPGLRATIARPKTIRASWLDETGIAHTATMSGLQARCFQHELDHLNGKTIKDRLTPAAMALARKNAAKPHHPSR